MFSLPKDAKGRHIECGAEGGDQPEKVHEAPIYFIARCMCQHIEVEPTKHFVLQVAHEVRECPNLLL